MKKFFQIAIIIVCTILILPALAENIRQLSWEDLIPTHLPSEDPVANLTENQKSLAYWVIHIRENLLDNVQEDYDGLLEELKKATQELKDSGIDIEKVIAKRNKIRSSIVEGLNGQRIRISGYLLPLEVTGSKVTEFLLVPYVGACIHVPPPPPNQIVHVKIVPEEGYKSKKLYETVRITGVISGKSMVKELYFVDGSAGINIGYTMQADRVEPYKE